MGARVGARACVGAAAGVGVQKMKYVLLCGWILVGLGGPAVGGVLHCFNGTTNAVSFGPVTFPCGNSDFRLSAGAVSDFAGLGGPWASVGASNDVSVYISADSTNVVVYPDADSAVFAGYEVGLGFSAVVLTCWAIVRGLRTRAPY